MANGESRIPTDDGDAATNKKIMTRPEDKDQHLFHDSTKPPHHAQHQSFTENEKGKEKEKEEPPSKKARTSTTTTTTNTATSTTSYNKPKQIRPKCNTSTLYVSNLHPRITEPHLQKLFQSYGSITRIFFARHKQSDGSTRMSSPHKGYAFVDYKLTESAQLAMEKIDGKTLLGRSLVVRPAHNKSDASSHNDGSGGVGGAMNGKVSVDVISTGNLRMIRKQKNEVENKIELVKRAIEEAKRKKV